MGDVNEIEAEMIDAMARAIAISGTSHCSADELSDDELALFRPEARDALTAIRPHLAAIRMEALEDALNTAEVNADPLKAIRALIDQLERSA